MVKISQKKKKKGSMTVVVFLTVVKHKLWNFERIRFGMLIMLKGKTDNSNKLM